MHELSTIVLVDVRGVIVIFGEEVIQRGGHSSGKGVCLTISYSSAYTVPRLSKIDTYNRVDCLIITVIVRELTDRLCIFMLSRVDQMSEIVLTTRKV